MVRTRPMILPCFTVLSAYIRWCWLLNTSLSNSSDTYARSHVRLAIVRSLYMTVTESLIMANAPFPERSWRPSNHPYSMAASVRPIKRTPALNTLVLWSALLFMAQWFYPEDALPYTLSSNAL